MQGVHFLRMMLAGLLCGLLSVPVYAESLMALQVGEVRVLSLPDVARLAVGDGHVINAVTTDEKEIIIFARHEGLSTLQVWSEDGRRHHYQIEVAPEGARQTQKELQVALDRIPGLRVSLVGDKLLVEGDTVSDADRERLQALRERYPQLLDFTGQVGWDRMVLLDVQVLELPRHFLRELGVQWDGASTGGLTAGLALDGGSRRWLDRPGETVVPVAFPAAPAMGYLGINVLMAARLQALVEKGDAVVLAQPQLLARSGALAEFLAGGEVPYSTVDANGNVNTAFKPYGVSLRITPRIERNDIIRSSIEVEVSAVDNSYAVANGPALKTRRAATEFNVRSGQTLVLAGFLSRELARNADQLPGLAQIPILGRLFQSRRFQQRESELAIFVRPVVVSAEHGDVRRRVQAARQTIDEHFPRPPVLNLPLEAHAGDIATAAADPWSGPGSQWHTDTAGGAIPILEKVQP